MQILILFLEFFKIGLCAVGGGLATLPFLYDIADKYPWLSTADIADMIAISESTPGPLGVNMATYAGFQCYGILGGIIATLGLVTPSVIIIIIVYHFLERFRNSTVVERAFDGLRPIVVGLIAASGFGVIMASLFDTTQKGMGFLRISECILFAVVLLISKKIKRIHPIWLIVLGAVCGIVFQL